MFAFDTCRRWLQALGLVLAAVGLAMAAAAGTPLFDTVDRFVDPAFWGSPGPDAAARDFQAWAYGVWGATIAGWGIAVAFIAAQAFRRREAWAWHAIALGTALWFVLDTGRSLAHGVTFNVAVNIFVLLAVAVPLLSTRRSFR